MYLGTYKIAYLFINIRNIYPIRLDTQKDLAEIILTV